MKVVTSTEMQLIDRRAITQKKIPALLLMESAGRIAANFIEKEFPLVKRIIIIAGTGNNSGDGFVLARYLTRIGFSITIFIAGNEVNLKENPKINLDILRMSDVKLHFFNDLNIIKNKLKDSLNQADLCIDAMLGIGLKDEVRGFRKDTIKFINSFDLIKIAIDIPSGIICDDYNKNSACCSIKADYTLTMGLPKTGMIYSEGAVNCGKLFVLDIGFNDQLICSDEFKREFINCEYAKAKLPSRNRFAHKGNMGTVTIVAGSNDYLGASILTAYGALMSGSGLVKQVIPNINGVLPSQNNPDIVYHILESAVQGYFQEDNLTDLIENVNFANTVVIGPGIGRNRSTEGFVIKLVEFLGSNNKQIIIDADALFHLSSNLNILEETNLIPILTPHLGEFSQLSGFSVEAIIRNREELGKEFAAKYGVILLLKDAITTIFHPDGRISYSDSGNPGMAKGGMGDLLAGLIASLIGQGVEPYEATATAVYIHGIAGSMMAAVKGETGLIASKVAEYISAAILQIKSEHLDITHLSNEPILINYLGRYTNG